MSVTMRCVHTIPVPAGWSIEQAWEAIRRGDLLKHPAGEPMWANIETTQDDEFVRVLTWERQSGVSDSRIEAAIATVGAEPESCSWYGESRITFRIEASAGRYAETTFQPWASDDLIAMQIRRVYEEAADA